MDPIDKGTIDLGFDKVQELILEWGKKKGWNDDRSPGELIALMHSELSEALEEYRKDEEIRKVYLSGQDGTKPEGFFIELADCMIRILHMAALWDVSIVDCLVMKMEYNERRAVRHGGKTI